MYNGVGLATPRRSGTNGYVQRNLSHVAKRPCTMEYTPYKHEEQPALQKVHKKPNEEILEHQRKRQVAVQIEMYKEELREQGYVSECIPCQV